MVKLYQCWSGLCTKDTSSAYKCIKDLFSLICCPYSDLALALQQHVIIIEMFSISLRNHGAILGCCLMHLLAESRRKVGNVG